MKRGIIILASFFLIYLVYYGSKYIVKEPKMLLEYKISSLKDSVVEYNELAKYVYDNENNLREIQYIENGSPNGYYKFLYDEKKNVIRKEKYLNNHTIEGVDEYEYKNENLIKISFYKGEKDTLKRTEEVFYDDKNQVVKLEETKFINEDHFQVGTTFYEYLENNVVKEIKKGGSTNIIKFDKMKNPRHEMNPRNFFRGIDANNRYSNNRVSLKNENGEFEISYTNTYDKDKFLIKQVLTITNNNTLIKEYKYNR